MSKILRKLAAAGLLALGVGILAFVMGSTDNAGNKDFTAYWAAGHLLARRANPYDVALVLRLEKSVGFKPETPLLMRNPPYALPLALPLGLVGAKLGAVLWSLLLVGGIVVSVRLFWSRLGRPPDVHLFAYMFAPAVSAMIFGQTSPLILAGLAVFLHFHRTRSWVAGAALTLAFIKPHLLLPFALVLLLWALSSRNYKVIGGAALSLACAIAIPMSLDHSLWRDYLPVLRGARAESQLMPTASAMLRVLAGHHNWVQFLPAFLGSVWAAWYFLRHREDWDWHGHGPLVLLVSLLVAPYSWFPDELIALPAIMLALDTCAKTRYLMSFLAMNTVLLLMLFSNVEIGHPLFFFWTPLVWLIWYWLATRTKSASSPAMQSVAAAQ
jgi:hypothetical protein